MESVQKKVNMNYNGGLDSHYNPMYIKEYWIKENVLKLIYNDLCAKRSTYEKTYHWGLSEPFSYKSMKYLINRYGKTNKQIAEEVYEFCSNDYHKGNNLTFKQRKEYHLYDEFKPEFYGYYSDYDWVAFCWLFGRMIDLPKSFPMYCRDLKQELDNVNLEVVSSEGFLNPHWLNDIKKHPDYPKQTNEHNALADAKWNYKLYKFLKKL